VRAVWLAFGLAGFAGALAMGLGWLRRHRQGAVQPS
jgi:hypothetical protein